MIDLSGQTLGRYHLIHKVYENAVSVEYKAHDAQLDNDVLVRFFFMDRLNQENRENGQQCFELAAKNLKRLDHSNIGKVIDYGVGNDVCFLVRLNTTSDTMAKFCGKPISYKEAIRYLIPITRALYYAHINNIIHHELNPSNILITDSGEPIVVNFGIADLLDPQKGIVPSQTIPSVGTPEYMAPEQWNGELSPLVDIYSLGAILFELVTGQKPLADTSLENIKENAINNPLPKPASFINDLPDQVEQVISKSMAMDPEDRYQTMLEFQEALNRLNSIPSKSSGEFTETIPIEKKSTESTSESIPAVIPATVPGPDKPVNQNGFGNPPFMTDKLTYNGPEVAQKKAPIGRKSIILVASLFFVAGVLFLGSLTNWFRGKLPAIETLAVPQPTQLPVDVNDLGSFEINLFTSETDAGGGLQYLQSMADAYTEAHPNVTFIISSLDYSSFNSTVETSYAAGQPPDLLWMPSYDIGPFVDKSMLQPVDAFFDMSNYIPAAVNSVKDKNGETWGVPITYGGHLLLFYNKSLIDAPPSNTDDLITIGKAFQASNSGKYALVYSENEGYFFYPWLGGFGGKVTGADGITPSFDTPEMVAALTFVHDLKYEYSLVPTDCDYSCVDEYFREGDAAMAINGNWSISTYREALGDDLGVALLPVVSSTGLNPTPFTSGSNFALPANLTGDKLSVAVDFIKFATNYENQVTLVDQLSLLPALITAINDDRVVNDLTLNISAQQLNYATSIPLSVDADCVWSSWTPEITSVMGDSETPTQAAAVMQTNYESCLTQ